MHASDKVFDVFISYSTLDGDAASLIKQYLESKNIRCWKAPEDILPGESWPRAIIRALGNSHLMLLVWSCNAHASQEVAKELTVAMRNDLTVVPLRIDNTGATGEWEYHLANTHWMDAFEGSLENYLESLSNYLLHTLASKDSSLDNSGVPSERTEPSVVDIVAYQNDDALFGQTDIPPAGDDVDTPNDIEAPPGFDLTEDTAVSAGTPDPTIRPQSIIPVLASSPVTTAAPSFAHRTLSIVISSAALLGVMFLFFAHLGQKATDDQLRTDAEALISQQQTEETTFTAAPSASSLPHFEAAQKTSSIRQDITSATTPPHTPADSPTSEISRGVPVPGKPGFVTSPHAPNAGFIDVRGFSSGTEVNDPYTGRIFLVP